MLGRGWALNPELAGMTAKDAATPDRRPAEVFVRRGDKPLRILLGGRYLGPPGGPLARVAVNVDDAPLGEVIVRPDRPYFFTWLGLPSGLPQGPDLYARMTVQVFATSGGSAPSVGLEQFDLAGLDEPIGALVEGWFEPEANPETGVEWRWMSGRAVVEVRGAEERGATLTLAGESPLKNFDRPPSVTVRAGTRVLTTFSPAADFSVSVPLPAEALRATSGFITIETSRTFKPADQGSPDPRELGLRIYEVSVK
jgi:hypothetical protein